MTGRHRKADPIALFTDNPTDIHAVRDVIAVDLPPPAAEPPRHESFKPLYSGGPDPHETTPLEQLPQPLVTKDEPLIADRDPQPKPVKLLDHHGFFWSLAGFIIIAAALALALGLLQLFGKPAPAHCPAPPTVTVTLPPPPPENLP
jgi:hypothetical protein